MPKKMRLIDSLFTICCFGVMIFLAVVRWGQTPHIPMLLGCAIASIVALLRGCHWQSLQEGMIHSITQSLESISILLLISVLMGVWIASGIVPAMIYYGLQFISPKIFLCCAMVITSLISMVIGSWGAAGTLGLAFMGMAQALGIPAPIVAGAVISGAYVGDQLSPLSDSTNLTSAVIGVSVFDHVRYLFPTIFCAYLVSAGAYFLIGLQYSGNSSASIVQNTAVLLTSIQGAFHISPLLFLPMILLIICILKKVPALLSISVGILSAGVLGVLFQKNSLALLMQAAQSGYVSNTGNEMVDHLLTTGGIERMMPSICLIIIAMMFGGIMEKSGQMHALTAPVMRLVHSVTGLTTSVILTALLVNVIMPDQYVSVVLPGRMYQSEYDRQGIDRKKLGLALSGGGIATSALISWNTCGTFMASVLGVSTFSYAQYSFFNLSMPVLCILSMFLVSYRSRHSNSNKEIESWKTSSEPLQSNNK